MQICHRKTGQIRTSAGGCQGGADGDKGAWRAPLDGEGGGGELLN